MDSNSIIDNYEDIGKRLKELEEEKKKKDLSPSVDPYENDADCIPTGYIDMGC